jgi:hypothetical protein
MSCNTGSQLGMILSPRGYLRILWFSWLKRGKGQVLLPHSGWRTKMLLSDNAQDSWFPTTKNYLVQNVNRARTKKHLCVISKPLILYKCFQTLDHLQCILHLTFFFFLVALGFELWTSCLLGRCCNTWVSLYQPSLDVFKQKLQNLLELSVRQSTGSQ